MMVMSVLSHLVKPSTRVLEGVKTTLQKYGVALFAAVTLKVVAGTDPFVVLNDVPEAVLLSVIVGSVYLVVPVHVPSRSVKLSVPLRAMPPVEVTVAESFGSQFCNVEIDVESLTVKHSVWVASLEPRCVFPLGT